MKWKLKSQSIFSFLYFFFVEFNWIEAFNDEEIQSKLLIIARRKENWNTRQANKENEKNQKEKKNVRSSHTRINSSQDMLSVYLVYKHQEIAWTIAKEVNKGSKNKK